MPPLSISVDQSITDVFILAFKVQIQDHAL